MSDFKINLHAPYADPEKYAKEIQRNQRIVNAIMEAKRNQAILDAAEAIKLMHPAFSMEQCLGIAVNVAHESQRSM